jgi:hypothetical protein
MPSRRDLLAATATATTAASAGCLATLRPGKQGYLQLQAVSVTWHHDGERFRNQPVHLTSDGRSYVRGRVAAAYADTLGDLPTAAVPDALHERLEREFASVEYVAGVCGEAFAGDEQDVGCLNTGIDRGDLNRVGFGDTATVRVVDDDFEVVSVEEGSTDGWERDVERFDFHGLHADDGLEN